MYLEEHPDAHVHIFNSCSASSGEVLTALKIQELASSGKDFDTVVSRTSRYINEMETLFVLENLDNLRKNGRLTRSVHCHRYPEDQTAHGLHARGRDLQAGAGAVHEAGPGEDDLLMEADEKHAGRTLCITHCNCLERAFYLKEQALKSCRFHDVIICETGGISTVYANDGGIVVAY